MNDITPKQYEHESHEALWGLSDLVSRIAAIRYPENPVILAECARFTSRLSDDNGSDFDADNIETSVTLFPFQYDVGNLERIFNQAGIQYSIVKTGVSALDDEEPRKPVSENLKYVLIKVDTEQDDIIAKINKGTMLATAARYAAMFKKEFPEVEKDQQAVFIQALQNHLG